VISNKRQTIKLSPRKKLLKLEESKVQGVARGRPNWAVFRANFA